jgi:ankyrin repeat protein
MKRKQPSNFLEQKNLKKPLAEQSPADILKDARTILDSKEFSSELQRLQKFQIKNFNREMDFKKLIREGFLKLEGYQQYTFHGAVLIDSIDNILQFSKDKNINIDQSIENWGTPLVFACCTENLEMMRLLISLGADPQACFEGLPVLYYALRSGNLKVIEVLTQHGVKISPNDLEDLALNYVHPALRGGAISSVYYLFEIFLAAKNTTLILQLACLLWIAGVKGDCLSPLLRNNEADSILKTIFTNNKLVTQYVARFAPQKKIAYCYNFLSSWSGASKENLVHWIAAHNNQSALLFFLKNHLNLFFCKDAEGYTPIFWAIRWGSKEVFATLMQKIPGILTQQGPGGQYLSHSAAECGELEILKQLVKADPTLLTREDEQGATPIVGAVRKGQLPTFEFIEKEVKGSIQWRGKEGENLVHQLIKFFDEKEGSPLNQLQLRQQALLQYILNHFPYSGLLTMEDGSGYPPIAWAAGYGAVELIKIFCQIYDRLVLWTHRINKRSLVHQAAVAGRLNVFNYLKEKCPKLVRASLPHSDKDKGYPPLLWAAREGHLPMFMAIAKEFKTGLQWRSLKGGVNTNIVHELIISYGSDKDGQTDKQKRIQEVFLYLMSHCPDLLTQETSEGHPPISYTAGWGSAQLLVLFYQKYPQFIQWRHASLKRTLAHQAAKQGHTHVLDYLKVNCLDLFEAKDVHGKSPLDEAIAHDKLNVVQWCHEKTPNAFKTITDNGGNLLHQLASRATGVENIHRLEEVDSKLMMKVQIIDFLIQGMPGALDQVNTLHETPFDIAVKSENFYFLAYLLAIKPRPESSQSVAESSARSIIHRGVTHFLPLYWHFSYVPEESGYYFGCDVIHIILDYAIERASEFILLRVMKDKKAVIAKSKLLCDSIPHYLERYQQLAPGQKIKPLETDFSAKMIEAVVQDEYKKRYSGLFDNPELNQISTSSACSILELS